MWLYLCVVSYPSSCCSHSTSFRGNTKQRDASPCLNRCWCCSFFLGTVVLPYPMTSCRQARTQAEAQAIRRTQCQQVSILESRTIQQEDWITPWLKKIGKPLEMHPSHAPLPQSIVLCTRAPLRGRLIPPATLAQACTQQNVKGQERRGT